MKVNLRSLLACVILFGLLISACSAGDPPTFSITQPGQGNVLPSSQPVLITLSARYGSNNYRYFRWEIYDDGLMAGHSVEVIGTTEVHWAENGPRDGVHHIYARAQAFSDATHESHWLTTPDLCYWVGDNAPADFCNYETIIQPVTSGTATPALTPIVITRPNNNNGSNGGNPGGASGCGQYGDVSSCDAAGCSWNGSSCTVSP